MDISSVAGLTSALSQAQTGDAVSTLVLRKALDLQAQSARQLLPAMPQAANPPHLGKRIDLMA